jgi:hypothetical protein
MTQGSDRSYCFRIRFRVADRVHLATTVEKLVLADGGEDGERVILRACEEGSALGDAEWLGLRGQRYRSFEEAEHAAALWATRLRLAFSVLRLGADFGLRAPRGGFTRHGLKMLEGEAGRRVLDDVHGISVFECDPPPVFARIGGAAVQVGKPVERFLELMEAAATLDAQMSDRDVLAFDLFSASFFERSADARFLLLLMALETLIEQERRSDLAIAHLERLIATTRDAGDLPQPERDSLIGSLTTLKEESVRQAGRRLARTLGERKYMGESATTFFASCYELRSALVHGHFPRPDPGKVGTRAACLEGFVGDLLGAALIETAGGE